MFSYHNARARRGNGMPHHQIDVWVSSEQLAEMLAWCHKKLVPGDWNHHSLEGQRLGEKAVIARFYFLNQVDVGTFDERWKYQMPPARRGKRQFH